MCTEINTSDENVIAGQTKKLIKRKINKCKTIKCKVSVKEIIINKT